MYLDTRRTYARFGQTDGPDILYRLRNSLRRVSFRDLFFILSNVGSILFGVFYVFEVVGRYSFFKTGIRA